MAERLGREVIVWPGYCPTHARIRPEDILELKAAHPGAVAMTHPECAKPVRDAADEVLSTGQMCAFAKKSAAKEFIVATEEGILHRLRQENPDKVFYPVSPWAICPNMKKTTLENLMESLREMKTRVTVPADVAVRAKRAIDAMLAIG